MPVLRVQGQSQTPSGWCQSVAYSKSRGNCGVHGWEARENRVDGRFCFGLAECFGSASPPITVGLYTLVLQNTVGTSQLIIILFPKIFMYEDIDEEYLGSVLFKFTMHLARQ